MESSEGLVAFWGVVAAFLDIFFGLGEVLWAGSAHWRGCDFAGRVRQLVALWTVLFVTFFAGFGGIGRYRASDYKETCVCIRGHFEKYMYGFAETRSDGNPDPNNFGIVETVDMFPGGSILNN